MGVSVRVGLREGRDRARQVCAHWPCTAQLQQHQHNFVLASFAKEQPKQAQEGITGLSRNGRSFDDSGAHNAERRQSLNPDFSAAKQ